MDCQIKKNILLIVLLVQTITMPTAIGHRRRPNFCNEEQMGSTFLWTLPDREPPVYFFGTIHVPYTRVWEYVPWATKKAFESADSVFFELDLTDPETVAQLANCQMLPSGETLSDVLPGDIYRRLKRHLDYVKLMMPSWMKDEHRGLYAEYLFKAIAGNWEKKRPVWVMLMVNSLTESDVRSRGIPVLDLYLAREAARLGKRAGAVERVEEQCHPLNGLDGSQVLFALNQTLLLQESLRHGQTSPSYGTEDLVRHYNCGDLGSIVFGQDSPTSSGNGTAEELLLTRNMDRYFRRELIEKRNARMADRVLQLIRQYPDESFFFAFGAGHFLGNGSVLEYVQDGGYKVEQVAPDAKIRSYRRPHHHPRTRDPEDPFTNDLNPSRSWEDGFRRRYRKRGGQHHHGVQLLRTVSTPAPPRGKQRQFNDLWVKLDNQDGSKSQQSQSTLRAFQKSQKKHSNMWYSVPSSTNGIMFLSSLEKLLLTLFAASVWRHNHLIHL